MPIAVTVQAHARATPEQAFDAIIPVDLTVTLTGYGPLPAVTGVRDQVGDWDAAGQTRTIELKDGGELRERLIEVARPGVCAYEVVPVKGPLRLIVAKIDGRFDFNRDGDGTLVVWTYAFTPRRGTRPFVLLLAPLWRRYATQVIARFVAVADASAGPVGGVRE